MTVRIGEPHLFDGERAVFDKAISRSKKYMEWGMGGSTLAVAREGIGKVISVESAAAWANAVREHPEIAPKIHDGTISVLHANIGPVEHLGYPDGYATKGVSKNTHLWSNYIRVPWEEMEKRKFFPDLVYVDGRFRVACCLSIIIACKKISRGESKPLVLLHDVTPDRTHYDEVFRFFTIIENVNTIRYMKIREDINFIDLFTTFLKYVNDPR